MRKFFKAARSTCPMSQLLGSQKDCCKVLEGPQRVLAEFETGDQLEVIGFKGHLESNFNLREMGFYCGAEIEVLGVRDSSLYVLLGSSSRLALSREMAALVMVKRRKQDSAQ